MQSRTDNGEQFSWDMIYLAENGLELDLESWLYREVRLQRFMLQVIRIPKEHFLPPQDWCCIHELPPATPGWTLDNSNSSRAKHCSNVLYTMFSNAFEGCSLSTPAFFIYMSPLSTAPKGLRTSRHPAPSTKREVVKRYDSMPKQEE